MPRKRERVRVITIRHHEIYKALSSLIRWTVDGSFSDMSDIFPKTGYTRAGWLLNHLREMGFAEFETYPDCNSKIKWWRVTDAGRHAYEKYIFIEEMKRGLLGGGAVRSPVVGDQDRRVGMAVRETLEVAA